MTRSVTAVALTALVAAALAAGPVVAAQPEDSASFEEDAVVVTRGDTASITVSHDGPANLTIGSQEAGFEVRIPLDGSGTDTVDLDTYNTTAADPSDFLSVDGAVLETPPIDSSIEDGVYDMRVTMDGTLEAASVLDVRARNETDGEPGVAPGDLEFEDADAGDVLGRVTERDTVARGDYAAFVVNESGLEWALPDSSTDADLDSAVTAELVELDPEPNTVADEFSVDRVVSQVGDRDRFVVLWDTSDIDVSGDTNGTYELRMTLAEHSELVEEEEELVRERVAVAEPNVSLTAEPGFELAPWDGRTLSVDGETNVAPTTVLDVRALQETESRNAFWKQTAAVSENGAFSTSFDFSDARVPGEFPLWVLEYRDESEETVELAGMNASLTFDDQQVSDGNVVVENVSLSQDGFVAVSANGTTLGVSDVLRAGTHESVRVSLDETVNATRDANATAYADANENSELDSADRPYEVSGSIVRDGATVEPAPEDGENGSNQTEQTATQGTDEPTQRTDDATTTQRMDDATTERTLDVDEAAPLTPVQGNVGGGSSGGFVPVSPVLVVVAVAAGVVLAWRRPGRGNEGDPDSL